MSPDTNRELLQKFVDAFNRLDIDTLVADLDPDAELHEWPEGVGSRSYRGADGVREALAVWFEDDPLRAFVDRAFDNDEQTPHVDILPGRVRRHRAEISDHPPGVFI